MKREHYSLHFVFSLHHGHTVCLGSRMETWLLAWADVDQEVVSYELSGRTFEYDDHGKKKTAKVPLVAYDGQESPSYWDAVDTRGVYSTRSLDVKKAHAEVEGCRYRVFTSDFFESHLVEWKNRLQAHRWLQSAHDVDLKMVEKGVRLSTAQRPKSFQELSDELRCSVAKVQVASLRLWKQRKVQLPLRTTLLAHPEFRVEGRGGLQR
jgi:hypothetical protein